MVRHKFSLHVPSAEDERKRKVELFGEIRARQEKEEAEEEEEEKPSTLPKKPKSPPFWGCREKLGRLKGQETRSQKKSISATQLP